MGLGGGGLQIGRWANYFLPLQKELGAVNDLAVLKGEGGTTSFGVVSTCKLEVIAILKVGEVQNISTL